MSVLVLAEKWGVCPWDITGEEITNTTRRRWYRRGVMYYSQINTRDEIERKRLEAKYGG